MAVPLTMYQKTQSIKPIKIKNFILGLLLVLLALLVGCASKPVIDTKGVDMEAYKQDLAECEEVAEQLEASKSIAKSALAGAAVEGVLGLITSESAGRTGAAIGGIMGGTAGGLKYDEEKSSVIKRCLMGRGYKVLN